MEHSVISKAVQDLRLALAETQQQFAFRMKTAIRTIARWEADRPPRGRFLAELADIARSLNRHDLVETFSAALQDELIDPESALEASIMRAIAANRGKAWLLAELERLVADAQSGSPLNYPDVLDADRKPDLDYRVAYLEGLLVELRYQMEGSAEKLVNAMADELLKQQPGLTVEQARARIWIQHPKLHQQWNQEDADTHRGTRYEAAAAVYGTRQHAKKKAQAAAAKKPLGKQK